VHDTPGCRYSLLVFKIDDEGDKLRWTGDDIRTPEEVAEDTDNPEWQWTDTWYIPIWTTGYGVPRYIEAPSDH
jgi:hypothetical protein